MSIRKRQSKKYGITYQVYFNYLDPYTKERKSFSKSGFKTYEDALLFVAKQLSKEGITIFFPTTKLYQSCCGYFVQRSLSHICSVISFV